MSQICTAAYVHDIVQGIGGLTEGVAVQCSRRSYAGGTAGIWHLPLGVQALIHNSQDGSTAYLGC